MRKSKKLGIIGDWCSTSSYQKKLMWICANYPADIVIALSPDESNEVFCSDENKVTGGRGDVETEREREREVTLKQLFITRFLRVYFGPLFK